jgi:hypothetical protein
MRVFAYAFAAFAFACSLTAAAAEPPRAQRARVLRYNDAKKIIPELKFVSGTLPTTIKQSSAGVEEVFAQVAVTLNRPGWILLIQDHRVAGNLQGQYITQLLLVGEKTPLKLTVVGPKGQTQTEWAWLQYSGWRAPITKNPAESAVTTAAKPERPSQWWFLFRGAESVAAYTTDDKDLDVKANGAALVAMYSGELRWRGERHANQNWVPSGALNLEVINQKVLGESFTMPRTYARYFYGREFSQWKLAPFVQLSYGQSGIFIVQNQTQARSTKVTRMGMGVGGAAVYGINGGLGLSFLGLIRHDTGGTSSEIPSPLVPSNGYELGFGLVVPLSAQWSFEGRLRSLYESYQWKPASGASGNSSQSNNFLIMDLGLGYRF